MAAPPGPTSISDGDLEKGRASNATKPFTGGIAAQDTQPNRPWLRITDASLDGLHSEIQACVHEEDDVEKVLSSLPELGPSTARIYDFSTCMDPFSFGPFRRSKRDPLMSHLSTYVSKDDGIFALPQRHRRAGHPPTSVFELSDIRRQWSQWNPNKAPYSSVCFHHERIKQSSLRETSTPKLQKVFATVKCCCVGSDQLIFMHGFSVASPLPDEAMTPSLLLGENVSGDDSMLTNSKWTREQYAKLLLLQIVQLHLHELSTTLKDIASDWGGESLEPGITEVDAITLRIAEGSRLQENARGLTDLALYIMEHLEDSGTAPSAGMLKSHILDGRFQCRQILATACENRDRAQRAWDLHKDILNVHESQGVKRLTLLAAVFLPLSLSSSILSMDTRFKDLNLLLYDFLGVFVLLASIAVLFYAAIVVTLRLSRFFKAFILRQRSTTQQLPSFGIVQIAHWLDIEVPVIINVSLFIPWAIVLVSFLVGMLKDAILGVQVLGYTVATSLFLAVLFCGLVYFVD